MDAPRFVSASGDVCVTPIYDHFASRTLKCAAPPSHRAHRALDPGLRGHNVLLDVDLANLYGVETKVLLQGLKRNLDRFQKDFMFQLNDQEFRDLRSQFVTSSRKD